MGWLALVLLLLGAPARASVVDRIVVVVEQQLVMESDIRLEQVLAGLDPSPSPFWDRERVDARTRLVQAAIFRELAGDVALYEPGPDALVARMIALRGRFPNTDSYASFLEFWGLTETGLARVVRRRMIVELFLARNLQVDPDDRSAWYAECEALLEQVRPRFRIREIALRGAE